MKLGKLSSRVGEGEGRIEDEEEEIATAIQSSQQCSRVVFVGQDKCFFSVNEEEDKEEKRWRRRRQFFFSFSEHG